jgi:mono/diheme cytochrome c family protein
MKRKIVYCIFIFLTSFILFNSCQSAEEIQKARYFVNGKNIYEKNCQNCHGDNGEGLASLYPTLKNSKYITANQNMLACDIRFGLNSMPGNPQLTPIEIAYVINYIGNYFGNSIGFYSQDQTLKDLENCN